MRIDVYYGVTMAADANRGFDPLLTWTLLDRLRQERGIEFRIIDADRLDSEELQAAYEQAVVASARHHFRIRKVFGTNRSSGCFFGRGVPALIVREGESPIAVYPHETQDGRLISISDYLDSLLADQIGPEDLAKEMDRARRELGPIHTKTSELVHEGRRR
jgi:hypothetical protein